MRIVDTQVVSFVVLYIFQMRITKERLLNIKEVLRFLQSKPICGCDSCVHAAGPSELSYCCCNCMGKPCAQKLLYEYIFGSVFRFTGSCWDRCPKSAGQQNNCLLVHQHNLAFHLKWLPLLVRERIDRWWTEEEKEKETERKHSLSRAANWITSRVGN